MDQDEVRVRLGSYLRRLLTPEDTDADGELRLPGFRGSVRSLLAELGGRYPRLGEELLDGAGEPESHLLVVVNKHLLVSEAGLGTELRPGDLVEVHLVIAGG